MQSFPAGVHYMETSTHDQYGRNVEEVFTSLAQKILRERVVESGRNSQASIATDQSPLSRSKRYTLSLSRFKRKEKVNLTHSVAMYGRLRGPVMLHFFRKRKLQHQYLRMRP